MLYWKGKEKFDKDELNNLLGLTGKDPYELEKEAGKPIILMEGSDNDHTDNAYCSYKHNSELGRKLNLIDPGENLLEQLKREPSNLSKKQLKKWVRDQKEYLSELIEAKNYQGLLIETERLLRIAPKGNSNYFYFLRRVYARNLVYFKENRNDNLKKLIKLENILVGLENKLFGIAKEKSKLILNILEDCKDADEETFSKMIGFVDDYYNQPTI